MTGTNERTREEHPFLTSSSLTQPATLGASNYSAAGHSELTTHTVGEKETLWLQTRSSFQFRRAFLSFLHDSTAFTPGPEQGNKPTFFFLLLLLVVHSTLFSPLFLYIHSYSVVALPSASPKQKWSNEKLIFFYSSQMSNLDHVQSHLPMIYSTLCDCQIYLLKKMMTRKKIYDFEKSPKNTK